MTQTELEQLVQATESDRLEKTAAKVLLAANGNPEPTFEFSSVWVKVTVWKG